MNLRQLRRILPSTGHAWALVIVFSCLLGGTLVFFLNRGSTMAAITYVLF